MSIDYGTYVGPYARCAVRRIEEITITRACLRATCENHRRTIDMVGAFCNLCGTEIGDVARTRQADAVSQWDVSEAIDEALCGPGGDGYMRWSEANGAHLWMPNQHMPGRDGHLESRKDFAQFEIIPKQIDGEILQFQVTFEDALIELRARYGDAAVTVRWGIIQDYS